MNELIGKDIVVRTVTLYHVGRFVEISPDGFLVLDDAAWVADTGRWSTFLTTGKANEVEPFPGRCYVSLGAVVDVCEWSHALLRDVK